MYNRYLEREQGGFSPVPEEREAPRGEREAPPPPPFEGEGAGGYLRSVLDRLRLDRIEGGDLLLLGLLYFLFRQKADEELLVALALLLIL